MKEVVIVLEVNYGYCKDFCTVIRKARTVKEAEYRARQVAEKFANSVEDGHVSIVYVNWKH